MGHPLDLSSLYQTLILDHYRRPRNHGTVQDPDALIRMRNPTCGDEIELSLALDDDRVASIRFVASGCSISQASASMMSELLQGRTLEEAGQLVVRFKGLLRGGVAERTDASLGDLRALAGVARLPARVRCALLGWNAFEEALRMARPALADTGQA